MDASKDNPCAMRVAGVGVGFASITSGLNCRGGTFGAEMNVRTFDEIARERQEEAARIKLAAAR